MPKVEVRDPGGGAGCYGVPTATRIAQILRSHDAWREAQDRSTSVVDLAQHLVSQQRQQLAEQTFGAALPAAPVTRPPPCAAAPAGAGAATLPSFALPDFFPVTVGQGADSKALAERVSVLVAMLQQRCDAEKLDVDRRITDLGASLDARARAIEARLAGCEGRMGIVVDTIGVGGLDQDAGLREARVVVASALNEVQAKWQEQLAELQGDLRDTLRQLEELAGQVRRCAGRLEEDECQIGGQERSLERSQRQLQAFDEQLQALRAQQQESAVQHMTQQPPWFGQLEGAVANLDRKQEEQRMGAEVQMERLRLEVENLRRRCSSEGLRGWREELMRAVENRLDEEAERLAERVLDAASAGGGLAAGHSGGLGGAGRSPSAEPQLKEQRRLDETEAKLAALRIRVDAHDGRFGSIGERTEALCQQAVEAARQATLQQREEILQEADCQIRILRQRVESLSELSEELALRQVTGSTRRPSPVGRCSDEPLDELTAVGPAGAREPPRY